MSGCAKYKDMCTTSSVVTQCTNASTVVSPTTIMVGNRIKSLCTQMPTMDGCDTCDLSGSGMVTNCGGAGVLEVYAQVCRMFVSC